MVLRALRTNIVTMRGSSRCAAPRISWVNVGDGRSSVLLNIVQCVDATTAHTAMLAKQRQKALASFMKAPARAKLEESPRHYHGGQAALG